MPSRVRVTQAAPKFSARAVEHVAPSRVQRRFAHAPDPVGGILPALEQIERRQHAMELGLGAGVGVAVALDQPAPEPQHGLGAAAAASGGLLLRQPRLDAGDVGARRRGEQCLGVAVLGVGEDLVA